MKYNLTASASQKQTQPKTLSDSFVGKLYSAYTQKKITSFRFYISLVLVCFTIVANAQIPLGVEVNIFPPYPTQYNIWIADGSNYMITVQNNSDREFEYYIRAGIEGESGGEETFARISRDFFPIESLTIGPNEVQALTSVDLEDLYRNATVNDLDRSSNIPIDDINGELPEGTYKLCFEIMLYDNTQEIFLSPKICSESFNVSHSSLELVYPIDGSVWDAVDVPVTFQWMNNTSQGNIEDYSYVLSLYEIDPNAVGQESIYEYIETGANLFFETDPLPDLNYIYDADFGLPEFQVGNLYAARVRLEDASGSFFDGGGISNINTFWFGENPYADGDGDGDGVEEVDCFDRCRVPLPTNTTQQSNYANVESFTIGNFTVDDVERSDVTEGLQSISGTGYVTLDFLNELKIEVEYSGVVLNTENQAMSGTVTGKIDEPSTTIVETIGNLLGDRSPISQEDLGSLNDAISNILTINKLLNGEQVSLPFGIGQQIDGQSFTFAMVGFEATTESANIDFVNILDFGSMGEGFRLGVGASDVCVAPDGFGSEYKIHLLEDAYLPLDGDLAITFKGGILDPNSTYGLRDNQSPCYFEMACEGFKAVNLSGTVIFPQTMIKKEIDGNLIAGENAKGYFSTTYERDFSEFSLTNDPLPRTDFILALAMDDFQLSKLKGWGFSVDNATLDLSENQNPENLEFPEGYENDYTIAEEWKGFYIKDATLRTPKDYAEDGVVGTAAINHIIIENTVSLDIEAYNMLNREDGVFKGWSLGIDTFELKVLQNTLQHGHLDGKFGAPVMDADQYLDFSALIDEVTDDPEDIYYTFDGRVQPSEDLDIPMAIANASICQSSYLALKLSPKEDERMVEVFLKGDLDINTGNIGEAITGNAYMELADYQLHYNTVDGFVVPEEVQDGRGSYFGMEDNEAIDCSNLDYTSLQEAFDYMMDRMIESGENVFRTIANESDLDVEEEDGGTFRDGDEMNGLPIRFDKSRLEIVDGAPHLNLIVEAQLSPESIMEAGMIIRSQRIDEGQKFRLGNPSIEFYFTEGSISLDAPYDGSGLATNQPVSVGWTANFQDDEIRNRLTYKIQILELTPETDRNKLDSIYRATTEFFHEVADVSGSSLDIALSTVTPAFTSGKSYAFRLKAADPEPDAAPLNNDGYSNINVVTWGQTAIVGTNDGNNSACAERCSPSLPTITTPHPNPTSVSEFTMGNFTIEVTGTPVQSGNMISGDGIALFDGFMNDARVSISFLNVELNSEAQAMAGTVTGRKADPDLLDNVADYIAGNSNSDIIGTLNEFLDEARMITTVMTGGEIDLPFGIDVNMSASDDSEESNSVNIAFTDFNLTPTTSDIDFIFMLALPSLGEGFNFGLGAQDICISPEGFGSEARLYLPDDLEIPLDGEVELAFNGGQNTVQEIENTMIEPFFLEIDCDGFKELNISGSATFPRTMLIKEDPITGQQILNENVRGYFSMNLLRTGGDAYQTQPTDVEPRTNILLNFAMDPFQVKGLDGWGFEVTQATLDLSEAENATGMNFPDNYDMDDLPSTEMWTGFYLKQLKFRPPNDYQDPNDGVELFINDLLIDPQFSAVFTAENLLSYANGNIKGWGMSIDSFGLSILQNNFQSGGMRGVMGAPPMDDNDRLLYRAIIDRQVQEEDEDASYLFRAVVRPESDSLAIPMFVAKASICPSSYVGIQIGKGDNDTQMELFLKTSLSIDFTKYAPVDLPIGGAFNLALADFQLQYNTVNGFVMESEAQDGKGTAIGLGLGSGDACTATPYMPDFAALVDDYQSSGGGDTERSVAGAGVESSDGSSNTSSVDDDGNTQGEGIGEGDDEDAMESAMNGFPIRLGDFDLSMTNGAPQVSFTVDLALASGGQGFAAGAGLTIYTEKGPNAEGKEKIKFKNVGFDCARLAVDLDFLDLLACLCHESSDVDGATTNGYFGRVIVNAMDEIFIDLQGGFATYKQNPDVTNYGTEDYHGFWYVDGTFASNTGIPMGPLRLNALGGGIYWNMQPPLLPGQDELESLSGASGGGAQEVADCINDLASTYDITVPNGGAPLDVAPVHQPGTYAGNNPGSGTYGLRAIKFNAGLTFMDPKFVIFDPMVQVVWAANQGINEVTAGGYMYFLQEGYLSRGAASPPTTEEEVPETAQGAEGASIEGEAKINTSGSGSKLWLSAFNSFYFDRFSMPGRTLTAFHGYGGLYLNIIPNVLYGDDTSDEQYRMISHDVVFTHKNHERAGSLSAGEATGMNGDLYWHVYLGNPYRSDMGRGRLVFDLAGAAGGESAEQPSGSASIEVTAYAMLGHGIPTRLPDPPAMIMEIINGDVRSSGEEEDSGYDGDQVDTESASREELGDKTSGFAFGVAVGVNAGFDKVIYANLEVVLGMDLLFMNVAGMQCIAPNGTVYEEPGAAGYYGMGQIFAGIRGAVGVRGRILGREVNVEFLSLAAAMLIQAGGPNPFWIDGRAAVRYSVLGGIIKGSAEVEVEVGDKCYPYNAGPFSLDVIDKVYPTDAHRDDNAVNPYIQPKVTFKMPVGVPGGEWAVDFLLPEVDPDGNTTMRRIAPVMDHFRVYDRWYTSNQIDGEVNFSETRKSVRFAPTDPMADSDQQDYNKRYKLDVRIRAKERVDGEWRYISEFVKDSIVRFEAGPLPPYEEAVTFTNPIRGQRYFMPQEWTNTQKNYYTDQTYIDPSPGTMMFFHDIRNTRMYSIDDDGNTCYYEIVWRKTDDGEEIDRYRLTSNNIHNKRIEFPLPNLANGEEYVCQFVRKTIVTNPIFGGQLITLERAGISEQTAAQYDVANNYTVTYTEDSENDFMAVEDNETLIHMVAFRTSQHNTLAEKIADTEIDVTVPYSGYYYTNGLDNDIINFDPGVEPFEEIEFEGYTNTIDIGAGTTSYFTKPRIRVIDPFEGDFYDDVAKPKLNTLIDKIRDRLDDRDVGLRMLIPDNLDILDIDLMPELEGINGGNNWGIENFPWGGPSANRLYERSFMDDSEIVTYEFIPYYYTYLNSSAYDDNLFETYGNNSVYLDEMGSSSALQQPLSQNSDEPNFISLAGIIGNDGGWQLSNNISINYHVRENVRAATSGIIDWTNNVISEIQDPTSSAIIQSWNETEIENHFASTFSAFNSVVNSILYRGDVSTTHGYIYMKDFSYFKPSKVKIYYNVDRVDNQQSYMTKYGSLVERTIDD